MARNCGLTVLHNITDDTELVKVATSALGTEWLLEGDLDVVNVVAVPGGAEELVTEAKNEDVLDHLLTQVVVDTEDLLFLPIWLKSALQLSRAAKVLTEWLFDLRSGRSVLCRSRVRVLGEAYDDSRDTVLWVAVLLEVLGDGNEDTWWEGHVEDAVVLLSA